MSSDGISDYEHAVTGLLKEGAVRERWEPEEFWSVVAALVVHLSTLDAPEQAVERELARIRRAARSLIVAPVANVQWNGPVITFSGRAAIGRWDESDFVEMAVSLDEGELHADAIRQYIQKQPHRRPMVGIAAKVPGQRGLAFSQTSDLLTNACDLGLLFDTNKDANGLYSLRGAWNRPGMRGLSMDRTTIQGVFGDTGDSHELASRPLLLDVLGEVVRTYWYSADPVPLDKIFAAAHMKDAVEKCMFAEHGLSPRMRVAARWFAEAFWSTELDDAALALGVALDALIGSTNALPGRAMRERFALLEPQVDLRAGRAARYEEIFSVRSSVAHGGKSSRLNEDGFVRGIQEDVTWAAWRLYEAEKTFALSNNAELEKLFEDLRWGSRSWPI